MQVNVENVVIKVIKSYLEDITLIEEIGLTDDLKIYGVDSLKFIKIVVGIEAELGLEFEDDALNSNKFPTVESIVKYVNSMMQGT
jgi:acyl carrier protein